MAIRPLDPGISSGEDASNIAFDGTNISSFLTNSNAKVINSIAELRDISKTKYTKVFVTGYYAPGDGGGGMYWYDNSDTSSSDNGGTIIKAADGGRWKLSITTDLSVKHFGARGDNSNDDTEAIQRAINNCDGSGGVLYFPHGTYLVSSTISVFGSWRRFYSSGLAVGLIGAQIKATVPGLCILDCNMQTVCLENLSFNSNESGDQRNVTNSVGVLLRQNSGAIQQDDVRINNCWFAGFGLAAISTTKLQGCHINNCTIEYCGTGIKCCSDTEDLTFYQNIIKGCRFYNCVSGIQLGTKDTTSRYLTNIKWNIISDCIFDFCGRYTTAEPRQAAISLYGDASYTTINSCQFANQMCSDIVINRAQGVTISSCILSRAGRSSIDISSSTDIVINSAFIDNPNSGYSVHSQVNSAINVSGSNVRINNLNVYGYGTQAIQRSLTAISTSKVQIYNSSLANGTNAACYADSTSSVLYSDIVEGAWTPVLTSSGGQPTAYTSSGSYYISGDRVTITGVISVSEKGAAMSGGCSITGIPFSPVVSSFTSNMVCQNVTYSAGDTLSLYPSGSSMLLFKTPAGSSSVGLDSSLITSTTLINFSATFTIPVVGTTINVNSW